MEHSSESLTPKAAVHELQVHIQYMKSRLKRLGGGESLADIHYDDEFEESLTPIIAHAENLAVTAPDLLHGKYEDELCAFVRFISQKMDNRGFIHARKDLQDRLYNLATTQHLDKLAKISHAVMDTKFFTLEGKVDRVLARLSGATKKKRMD